MAEAFPYLMRSGLADADACAGFSGFSLAGWLDFVSSVNISHNDVSVA